MKSIPTLIEKAFDYRGDVTLVFRDGRKIEGFLFNREAKGTQTVKEPFLDMLLPGEAKPQRFFYREIVDVEFTGEDTAAGKSWEEWQAKLQLPKAAG